MAWADSDDLIARYDARRVGQLLADDGTKVEPADLATNANLGVILDDATSVTASALYRGGRYTADDIAALDDTSLPLLKRLVCDLAFALLHQRRGYTLEEIKGLVPGYVAAQEMLTALADGVRIFGLEKAVNAGKPVRAQLDRRKTLLSSAGVRLYGDLTTDATESQPKRPGGM